MKLPSLVKKPNYQRYDIKPRYYDPVKEDIENRTSRIKAEMGLNENVNLDAGYRSQIEGSFRKNMKHAKNGVDQTTMLRLIIFVILVLFVGGFVYIGKDILYLGLLYVPYLIWKKMRK